MYQNKEIEQQYYIHNCIIKATESFTMEMNSKTPSVYEVIRIMKGVSLFLEEHLDRLNQSIALLGHSYKIDLNLLKNQIHRLIEINNSPDQNIKIVVNQLDSDTPNLYLFFINSKYPSLDMYEKGVSTILFSAIRKNPNVKAVAVEQREMINSSIRKAEVYEALLVNENQEITEGSRSNLFIVKDNILYTAPAKDVLLGITRQRVINLCLKLNISIVECPITVAFLKECDGLFLTGTSPKVLPISSVDHQLFSSPKNSVILRLQKAYDELIQEYINNYNVQ